MSFSRLVPRAALAVAFIAGPAVARTAHPLPWKDIRASDCSIVVEAAPDNASVALLRCKGRVDVQILYCDRNGRCSQ